MDDHGKSLFDRIGGTPAVERLVTAFYERVLADPELAPFFEKTEMNKLRSMQREFFSAALGGPLVYSGKPLSHVHFGRGITTRHLTLFVEHMLETLKGFDLDEQDVDEIVTRVSRYSDEIVGGAGVDG